MTHTGHVQEAAMPCRLPKLVLMNISLLMPHLGGKAYSIRSAIVSAIGHVLHKGFPDQQEEPQEEGAPGELRLCGLSEY